MSNPYDTQVGGSHYKDMKIQPSEFINKNKLQFAEGNAIKYICRHGSKGQQQDLEKAKHYIDMIIERDYGDDAEKSKVFESDIKVTYNGVLDEEGYKKMTNTISNSYEEIEKFEDTTLH